MPVLLKVPVTLEAVKTEPKLAEMELMKRPAAFGSEGDRMRICLLKMGGV